MLRLIMALGIIYALNPDIKSHNEQNVSKTGKTIVTEDIQVTTYDAFSAVNSVIQDLGQFCQRNEEACITGSTILTNAHSAAKSGLGGFVNTNNQPNSATGNISFEE